MSMKKIFSVVCAVSVSAALFAGVTTLPSYQSANRLATQSENVVEKSFNAQRAAKITYDKHLQNEGLVRAVKKDTTINLIGSYNAYYPSAFQTGTPLNLFSILPAYLNVPYSPKGVLFLSDYTKGTWTLNSKEVAKDTAYIIVPTGEEIGSYELPVYQNNTEKIGTDTTVTFSEYQFGRYFTKSYEQYGFTNGISMAEGWTYMTKCQITTEVESYIDDEGKVQDTYGSNTDYPATYVSKTDVSYLYGSGMKIPLEKGTAYVDTIISIVENSDVMAIQGISMGVFGLNQSTLYYEKPKVSHVRLTLYPVEISQNEEGRTQYSIDYAHPYATSVTDSTSFTPMSAQGQTIDRRGTIYFGFTEKDPDTGIEESTIVTVEGDFAVVLTELNDDTYGKNNFGIMTDGDVEDPLYANTYLKLSLNGQTFISQLWNSPRNLLINFVAAFPVITNAPKEVELSLKGETKEITLNTDVQFDLMDFEFNDWIDIDGENITITEDNQEYFNNQVVLKITVPANAAAREGKIVINALGKEYSIAVKQVETTAIDNVKFLNDGKTYNLLGIEVDENYKGVVIRNGEKFIQ